MTKAGKSAGRECSSIGLEHTATNGKVESSNLFIPSKIYVVTSFFFKLVKICLVCEYRANHPFNVAISLKV